MTALVTASMHNPWRDIDVQTLRLISNGQDAYADEQRQKVCRTEKTADRKSANDVEYRSLPSPPCLCKVSARKATNIPLNMGM